MNEGRVFDCPGCGQEKRHRAFGWCDGCYQRWKLAGRPEEGPPPPWQCHRGFDEVAVELVTDRRIADRDVPALTCAERQAATAILTGRGWSAGRIAERLHCTKRSVVRYRAADRIEAAR